VLDAGSPVRHLFGVGSAADLMRTSLR